MKGKHCAQIVRKAPNGVKTTYFQGVTLYVVDWHATCFKEIMIFSNYMVKLSEPTMTIRGYLCIR